MRINIDSKITIENFSKEIEEWCEEKLVLKNPTYETLKKLGKEDTIKRTHVPEKIKNYSIKGNKIIIPFGCLKGIWKLIKNESNLNWNFNNNKFTKISHLECPLELYDYQETAISTMVKAKGGILVSPCGSGKTEMGIEIIRRLGLRFLWLTHTEDLLTQTYNRFKNMYPSLDIGLTTKGELNIGKDGCITTVQTMSRIDSDLYKDDFDVVMVDECAHCVGSPTNAKMFYSVISKIPARYKYGLTATPARADSLIATMYQTIGYSNEGKEEPTYKVDKKEVKTIICLHKMIPLETPFDYNDENLFETDGTIKYNNLINFLSYNEERNNKIVENIVKCHEEGRLQVVLCHRVDHCALLTKKINSLGIKAVCVTGKIKSKNRDDILNQKIPWEVLVSTYSLLKEGISIKALDTLHLTTPQKDKTMIVQCVGRIERYLENKKQPITYDYVDTNISYCLGAYSKRKSAIKNRF